MLGGGLMKTTPQKGKIIPKTVDEYLGKLSEEQRDALERLRKAIKNTAPGITECISYAIPTFRLGGKMLVSLAAWKEHCAFYAGAYPIKVHQALLKAYDTDKGTIRFQTNKPLTIGVVQTLVATRIKQVVD